MNIDNSQNSFVFYKSFYEAIKRVPEQYQLELYNAICIYSLEGQEPTDLSDIAEAIFILIKPNIDSAQKRYKASVENGKRGGRPKKETQEKPSKNLEETQEKPKQNLDKDVDVDIDKDIDLDIDNNVDIDVEKPNQTVADALQQKFVECTGSTNLYAIQECLSFLDDLPYEVIEIALIKTSDVNGNWKYAKKILNNWVKAGINTVEKVKTEELNYKSKKHTNETEEEKQARRLKELEEMEKEENK